MAHRVDYETTVRGEPAAPILRPGGAVDGLRQRLRDRARGDVLVPALVLASAFDAFRPERDPEQEPLAGCPPPRARQTIHAPGSRR